MWLGSLDRLASELRSAHPGLVIRLGDGAREIIPSAFPRSGTALGILRAALGDREDFVAVATPGGIEVLPPDEAESAARDLETLERLHRAMEAAPVGAAKDLPGVLESFGRTAGVRVVVDPDLRDREVVPGAATSIRKLLDSLEGVAVTVVDGVLVVVARKPSAVPVFPASPLGGAPSFRGRGWRDWGEALRAGKSARGWAACRELARGGADALPVLEKLLSHPEPSAREIALAAVGMTGRAALDLRGAAADAIWRITGDADRVLPILRKTIRQGGTGPGIFLLAGVLVDLGEAGLPVVSEALESETAAVRELAYRTLAHLGPLAKPLAGKLRALAEDPTHPDRGAAERALAGIEDR